MPSDLKTAVGSLVAPYDTSLSPPFLSTPYERASKITMLKKHAKYLKGKKKQSSLCNYSGYKYLHTTVNIAGFGKKKKQELRNDVRNTVKVKTKKQNRKQYNICTIVFTMCYSQSTSCSKAREPIRTQNRIKCQSIFNMALRRMLEYFFNTSYFILFFSNYLCIIYRIVCCQNKCTAIMVMLCKCF